MPATSRVGSALQGRTLCGQRSVRLMGKRGGFDRSRLGRGAVAPRTVLRPDQGIDAKAPGLLVLIPGVINNEIRHAVGALNHGVVTGSEHLTGYALQHSGPGVAPIVAVRSER